MHEPFKGVYYIKSVGRRVTVTQDPDDPNIYHLDTVFNTIMQDGDKELRDQVDFEKEVLAYFNLLRLDLKRRIENIIGRYSGLEKRLGTVEKRKHLPDLHERMRRLDAPPVEPPTEQ